MSNRADVPDLQADNEDLKSEIETLKDKLETLTETLEASEMFREAYRKGKLKLYAMEGEIAEAAMANLPCSEGPVERAAARIIGHSMGWSDLGFAKALYEIVTACSEWRSAVLPNPSDLPSGPIHGTIVSSNKMLKLLDGFDNNTYYKDSPTVRSTIQLPNELLRLLLVYRTCRNTVNLTPVESSRVWQQVSECLDKVITGTHPELVSADV